MSLFYPHFGWTSLVQKSAPIKKCPTLTTIHHTQTLVDTVLTLGRYPTQTLLDTLLHRRHPSHTLQTPYFVEDNLLTPFKHPIPQKTPYSHPSNTLFYRKRHTHTLQTPWSIKDPLLIIVRVLNLQGFRVYVEFSTFSKSDILILGGIVLSHRRAPKTPYTCISINILTSKSFVSVFYCGLFVLFN